MMYYLVEFDPKPGVTQREVADAYRRFVEHYTQIFPQMKLAGLFARDMLLGTRPHYFALWEIPAYATLDAWFGVIGGTLQIGALIATIWLAALVRRHSSFLYTVCSVVCLAGSIGLWWALVWPVNAEWSLVRTNDPSVISSAYQLCRSQWEYGHLTAFAAWLAGVIALHASILRELRPSAGPVPVKYP